MLFRSLEAILMLSGTGALLPVQEESYISKAKKHTERLNAVLMHKARSSGDISHLASPVTGGGFNVPRFHQLFLLAIAQGRKQPQEWAKMVWDILNMQNQRLLKDGKLLETAEENLTELTTQAQTFAEKQLPIHKALQIA